MLAESQQFVISSLRLKEPAKVKMEEFKSCVVYICIGGSATIETGGASYALGNGETMLIPASLDDLLLVPTPAGVHLLQVHLPQPPKDDIYDGPEPEL